ncbi:MAG: glycosyltransferase family A protein [Cyanobacteria bacterium P01_A01_bin.116]
MSKVSVIIPAYNVEKTVLKTVNSVLEQSFTDFELIVINDGSTDGTLALLNEINHPRMKVFSFENGGLSTARNRGIAKATGDYVTFLDADDLWTPDKLALQVAQLDEHPDVGVVYSWTLTMSDDGTEFHPGKSPTLAGDVYGDLLISNFIASGSNIMVRRAAIEAIGGFDASLNSCEDWDCWLKLAAKWPFAVVPKPQILYRQTSGSMSSKVRVIEEAHLIVHHRAFRQAPQRLQHLEAASRCRNYQYVAQLAVRHASSWDDIAYSLQRLKMAVQAYPAILLQKKIYVSLVKISFLTLLSPAFGQKILRFFSTLKASNGNASHSKASSKALSETSPNAPAAL